VRDLGAEPVFCGYVPTPALALHAFAEGIPSLMVTGSHIPADRNGIKFYRPAGEVLKDDEAGMKEQAVTLPDGKFTDEGMLAVPAPLPEPVDVETAYLARYRDFFGADALAGLRIGVYQHSAVGRDIVTRIVEALGAEAVPLGRADSFIPVDTEAVRPEDIALAKAWAAEQPLDAIVSTDGDRTGRCWPTIPEPGCVETCWACSARGRWGGPRGHAGQQQHRAGTVGQLRPHAAHAHRIALCDRGDEPGARGWRHASAGTRRTAASCWAMPSRKTARR
jgi:hypothetical protein